MKKLFTAVLLITLFPVFAKDQKELVVKYDKDYYSPVANVVKFDLTLPPVGKSGYYVNISLDKNGREIYGRSFYIDLPETTLDVCFFDLDPVFLASDLNMQFKEKENLHKYLLGLVIIYSEPHLIETADKKIKIPAQSFTAFCKKETRIKWGQKTVIMILKNKNFYKNRLHLPIPEGFIGTYHGGTMGSPKPKVKDLQMQLSIGIAKTDIWKQKKKLRPVTPEEREGINKILSLDAYKNRDYNKMSDAELLKWYGKVLADRDYIEEKYKAAKVKLRDLNKMQAELFKVRQVVYARKLKIRRTGQKPSKKALPSSGKLNNADSK